MLSLQHSISHQQKDLGRMKIFWPWRESNNKNHIFVNTGKYGEMIIFVYCFLVREKYMIEEDVRDERKGNPKVRKNSSIEAPNAK